MVIARTGPNKMHRKRISQTAAPVFVSLAFLFITAASTIAPESKAGDPASSIDDAIPDCEKSTGPTVRDNNLGDETPRDYCYYQKAKETGDAQLCQRMQSDQWACFRALAVIRKDPKICVGIKKLRYESDVIRDRLEHCFIFYAWKTSDISACSSIPSSDMRERCELAPECESDVHRYASIIPEISPELTGSPKDDCYFRRALQTKNTKVCEKTQYIEIDCFAELAVAMRNPRICDGLKTKGKWAMPLSRIETCYERYGSKTGDRSYCDWLTSPKARHFAKCDKK